MTLTILGSVGTYLTTSHLRKQDGDVHHLNHCDDRTMAWNTGGILAPWDRWSHRVRVRVHRYYEHGNPAGTWAVTFEVENVGEKTTSLAPIVLMEGYGITGEKFETKLTLRTGTSRILESFTPVSITAEVEDSDKFSSPATALALFN